MEAALAALRDIHVPPPVSWWPPAIGYWLVCFAVVALVFYWLVQRRRYRMRRIAMKELVSLIEAHAQHNNDQRFAQDVSVLLRRVLITLGARERVAGLTGKQWINALQQLVEPAAYQFSDASVETLSHAIYQSSAQVKTKELINNCRQWIRLLPAQKVLS